MVTRKMPYLCGFPAICYQKPTVTEKKGTYIREKNKNSARESFLFFLAYEKKYMVTMVIWYFLSIKLVKMRLSGVTKSVTSENEMVMGGRKWR